MSNDEQFVSEIYQAQNFEEPSNELDRKVLSEAQKNMPLKTQAHQSNWRKLQWPVSVAASVVFVSVILFTQYSSFSPNLDNTDLTPTAKIDPFALADEATLDKEQQVMAQKQRRQQEAEILANRQSQEQKTTFDMKKLSLLETRQADDSVTETLSQPELANVAQKEALTLAARALDDVELDILPFELEESTPIDTGLKQEQEIMITGSRSSNSEAHRAAIEAVQMRAIKTMDNSDYLDQLLVNYTDIQSQINSLSEQARQENKQLKAQLSEIQNTVFDHLNLMKLAEPNLQIQQRYLDVLSDQQRQILVPE